MSCQGVIECFLLKLKDIIGVNIVITLVIEIDTECTKNKEGYFLNRNTKPRKQ